MHQQTRFVLLTTLAFIGAFLSSCKNFGTPDYAVTVTLADGIQGTPEVGTYIYKEFYQLAYEYTADEGYNYPDVTINGISVSASGLIYLYTNLTIYVKPKDIRGEWHLQMLEGSELYDEWDITFSGADEREGTFTTGNDLEGTWTIKGNDLTITFSNWVDYVLTGTISNMSGSWTGEEKTGTWSADIK